jgi:hypothetical protein
VNLAIFRKVRHRLEGVYALDGVSRRVIRWIDRMGVEEVSGFDSAHRARRRNPSRRAPANQRSASGRFACRAFLRSFTDEYFIGLLILQRDQVTAMVHEKSALFCLHHDKCHHRAVIPVELQHGRTV